MHERMKYITELSRHATKINIITPTCVLDKPEKQEALEYLKKDMALDVEYHPVNDEDTLIEIEMRQY